MTDNIKLPPLPKGDIAADTCPVMWVHSNEQLQAYAREAIEADRKRRGEPVALELRVLRFLSYVITAAGLLEHGKRDKKLASRIAAESYSLRDLFLTPRRPPSRKEKDWNAELSSWSDEDFVQVFHECPDLADRLRRVLAEQVKKKPYAQGSALGEFGIIPMCDQVDE